MTGINAATTTVLRRPRFEAVRRLPRPPISVMIAMAFILVVIVAAVAGPLISPYDPDEINLTLGVVGPSGDHLFGTDQIGRDILSRAIVGTYLTLAGPLVLTLGVVLIGGGIGILAGYVGGWVDTVIARWIDLMWSLPGLPVTLIFLGVIGGGYWGAVVVLIILNVPNDTRMFRAAALEQRGLPYVEAARTLGLTRRRIMVRHVGPNIMPLFVTTFILDFAGAITAMAGLAYLGFGVTPGTPNWGTMIDENRTILADNPAASLLPTALVVLVAISTDFIGNWLFGAIGEQGRSR